MTAHHDIAVLGSSPAGCAAAGILAEWGLRVALAEYPGTKCESPLADWTPREFWRLPGVGPSVRKASRATPFRAVCYHDAALERQTALAVRPEGGAFVQSADLARAMREEARRRGAAIVPFDRRPAIRLGESSVLLRGGRDLAAGILLIAQGSPQEALADLALPVRSQPRSEFTAAALEAPLPGGRAPADLAGTLHLVAFRQRGKLGLFFAVGGLVHIRLLWVGGSQARTAAELSDFLTALQRAEVLPKAISLRQARGAVWRPPAGEALDLETHVAKRCLFLGTAGGFADSITGSTLWAGVRSAKPAAQAAREALRAPDPQEPLRLYKNEWRKILADGLRPPSTSVDMLLPLLLANRNLVGQFTRAMFYGRSI